MDHKTNARNGSHRISRRTFLKTPVAGAVALAAPGLLIGEAHAAGKHMDLESFKGANIDWRMAEGEKITVGVIPAGYFKNLDVVLEDFRTLTGVEARLEMTPPGQIRQKAVLDLSSKTGTWASHAADPMYYMLYVANGWIDPIDDYLGDAKLTDDSWFMFEDIQPGHRGATSVGGRPYAIPFDGEATIQIYRKDVYDAKGIAPAETLDEYSGQCQDRPRPRQPALGLCVARVSRRGAEHVHLPLYIPRLRW